MPPEQPPMGHPEFRVREPDPVDFNNPVEVHNRVKEHMEQLGRSSNSSTSLQLPIDCRTKNGGPMSSSDKSDVTGRIDDYGLSFREDNTKAERLESYPQDETLLGVGTEGSVGDPETHRPGQVQVQSLADDLRSSMAKHADGRIYNWLPEGKLKRLCKDVNVSQELEEAGFNQSDVQTYTSYVCGNTPKDFKEGRSAQILFAILVLTRQISKLGGFYDAGICDRHFPFTWGENDMLEPRKTGLRDEKRPLFPSNEENFMWQFYREQWNICVPIISMHPGNQPTEYKLHSDTIMPWTFRRGVSKQGGHAEVFKIKIHPDHHRLTGHDAFALKKLNSGDPDEFRREIYALRKITPGDHVIPLFATFECDKNLSFLFPWAEGGNLADLMRMHPSELFPPASKDSPPIYSTTLIRWIAEQCAGIAQGLHGIHIVTPEVKGKADMPNNKDWKRNFGIHRDIKPENILRFTDKKLDRDLGKLKLADFGLTKFHTRDSRSLQFGHEGSYQTYFAPEQTKSRPAVSRKADVWALGCVFLTLLTWAIRGPGALTKFECARENERGSSFDVTGDAFFGSGTEEADDSNCDGIVLKQAVKRRIEIHKTAISRTGGKPNYLTEFLDFILSDMLVINQKKRAASEKVYEFLSGKVREYNKVGYHVTLPSLDASVMSEPGCTCDYSKGEYHCRY